MDRCPICQQDLDKQDTHNGETYYTCKRCGNFKSNKVVILQGISNVYSEIPLHLLSGYIREQSERNNNFVLLSNKPDDIEIIKSQLPRDNDVLEKARKLLLAIERRTKHPGQNIPLSWENDYPLAYCQNESEFQFYLTYLKDKGLTKDPAARHDSWYGYITVDGWRAIESYKASNAESDKVFVAMWFDDQTNEAYNNGISKAIEDDCGYKSIRIDKKEYIGKIDDEIIAEIRESRFIVADFTGQRQGVYYEAGFAEGLGLPVVWTCRKDHVEDLHFDTRQQNHIVWEYSEELREKLSNKIRAVIGFGPHKKK